MHDYLLATIGGLLIGVAAVLLMYSHGKVMGVSGIVSRLLPPTDKDWSWRLSFLIGMGATPLLFLAFASTAPQIEVTSNISLLIIAGLLVGVGTVIGNGCTSGHGVCGLPRFSKRSIIATVIFMGVAVLTVFLKSKMVGAL